MYYNIIEQTYERNKDDKLKITHLIQPRRSGKTTLLVRMFMLNPGNSIMLLHNIKLINMVIKRFPELEPYRKRIKSYKNSNILDIFRGWDFENLFIDDYENFNEKQKSELTELLSVYIIRNLFITGTSEVAIKQSEDYENYIKFKR